MSGSARVAVVGDIHVGATPYPVVARLATAVRAEAPDLVLVTGDLFDRSDGTDGALACAQQVLDSWSDAGADVIAIGGNHDAESALPARLRLPVRMRWLRADAPETVVLPRLGIAVHGVSVAEPEDHRMPQATFPAPVPGMVNIALLHTSLHGEWSKRACLPTPLEELRADIRYDVWALGHVHERMVLSEEPLIFYPGSSHARHAQENGPRGFSVVEIGPGTAPRLRHVDLEPSEELLVNQEKMWT